MATYTALNTVENITQSAAQDTLELTSTAVIQAGDSFNGGADIDEVLVKSLTGVTVDARAATFTSYEAVRFNNTSGTSRLDINSNQLPLNMLLSGVSGTAQQLHLYANTHGATIDLTSLASFNWGNEDLIVVYGSAGNDTLTGSNNIDQLGGGAGDDTFFVQTVGDTVLEQASEGTDTVNSTISFTLGANVENLNLTGAGAIDGIGNVLDNSLTGNAANNTLNGGGGTDTMIGGQGNDVYIVDDATDVVTEAVGEGSDTVNSSITYTLGANVENLTLTGAALINGTGNDLANILVGNIAKNTLTGGLGNDTYYVQTSNDIVVETSAVGGGIDTVYADGGFTLSSNIENLVLVSNAGETGNGNSSNNTITGGNGDDFIDGRGGGDNMIGGLGNDNYYVDNAGDVVVEALNAGTDRINSSISFDLSTSGANIENLTLTGNQAINGTGNTLANVLTGNSGVNNLVGGNGNDTIDGKAGADIMKGGFGADVYWVDDLLDLVDETGGSGIDLVYSTKNFTLATDVENLTLTGSSGLTGTGNTLANKLTGNSGANTLTGLAGNDTIDGGSGVDTMAGGADNDTYVVDNASDSIVEDLGAGTDTVQIKVDYTMAANVENLIALGTSNSDAIGNDLNNVMTGNAGLNSLSGGIGNDTLNGGAGVDTMNGGAGNDTFYVDNIADVVIEASGVGSGVDAIYSSKTYTLSANVEELVLTGSFIINGTGNADNNYIEGNSNKNILDGGAGADTLYGQGGDDTYIVDSSDTVLEDAGEGTDTVKSSGTYTLSATEEIENLTLTGTANINGTGNGLANVITGNNGINVLTGGAGGDTISAMGGNDTVSGGTGADVLSGGAGTDTFLYTLLTDSNTASGIDSIMDFVAGDKINVSGIDASTLAGDQAFIRDLDASSSMGEYSVSSPDVAGFVTVSFFNDVVAGADLIIKVKINALSDGDFVL